MITLNQKVILIYNSNEALVVKTAAVRQSADDMLDSIEFKFGNIQPGHRLSMLYNQSLSDDVQANDDRDFAYTYALVMGFGLTKVLVLNNDDTITKSYDVPYVPNTDNYNPLETIIPSPRNRSVTIQFKYADEPVPFTTVSDEYNMHDWVNIYQYVAASQNQRYMQHDYLVDQDYIYNYLMNKGVAKLIAFVADFEKEQQTSYVLDAIRETHVMPYEVFLRFNTIRYRQTLIDFLAFDASRFTTTKFKDPDSSFKYRMRDELIDVIKNNNSFIKY